MLRSFSIAVVLSALAPFSPCHALDPAPGAVLFGAAEGRQTARFYGQSVASNGSFLAIGAPGKADAATPGSVWIYANDSTGLSLVDVIEAPLPTAGDGFGQAVEFNGNQLLVGAPNRDVDGTEARGEVFVFLPDLAGDFSLVQTLQPGAAVFQGDRFGFHLSADQGWLAVGVPFAGSASQGQVQLFRYDGNFEAWVNHSTIDGAAIDGRLGLRVLLRGDRLLAAAPEESVAGGFGPRGFVYEYQRSGNSSAASYSQMQRFRPSTFPVADAAQVFGLALALSPDGQELVVGAPFDQDVQFEGLRGAVYVFQRSGGQWAQFQRVSSPSGDRGENFGTSLLFNESERLLVGDIREVAAVGDQLQNGAVHELIRFAGLPPGQNWTPGRSWNSGFGGGDFFGNSVGLLDGILFIGAPGRDEPSLGEDVGAAYVYFSIFADGFE